MTYLTANAIPTKRRMSPENAIGLCFVAVLHAAALYGLLSHQMLPSPADVKTLFVNFIAPPVMKKPDEPKRPPAPAKIVPPKPVETQQLVSQAPVVAATEYVAPPPPAKPAPEPMVEAPRAAPPAPVVVPAGPVNIGEELSVICAERPAPAYPSQSRRVGESGVVMVQVELDESGNVFAAKISSSSGYSRLDEAALSAVRTWHCTPARRNGQNVRAIALQPFKFLIQGK